MGDEMLYAMLDRLRRDDKLAGNLKANATPEVMDALAKYGVQGKRNAYQANEMKEGEKAQNTEMPGFIRYGNNRIMAPNAMEVTAAALRRFKGGQQEAAGRKALLGGFDTQEKANRTISEFDRQQYLRTLGEEQAPASNPIQQWQDKGYDPQTGDNFGPDAGGAPPGGGPRAGASDGPQSGPMHDFGEGPAAAEPNAAQRNPMLFDDIDARVRRQLASNLTPPPQSPNAAQLNPMLFEGIDARAGRQPQAPPPDPMLFEGIEARVARQLRERAKQAQMASSMPPGPGPNPMLLNPGMWGGN